METTKRICICIPNTENNILSIGGAMKIFEINNNLFHQGYEVITVSGNNDKPERMGNYTLQVDYSYEQITWCDLIIIPSLQGNPKTFVTENASWIPWLAKMYTSKCEIATMCTGVYLLAATGFLDGHEASSNLNHIKYLEAAFPKVRWKPEKIVTDYAGLYTSGGSLSSYNLILYLIEKYQSRQDARIIAEILGIDYPQRKQYPFTAFNNQKKHKDTLVLEIQKYIENHLDRHVTNTELAHHFALSERNLIRRFKRATSNTPRKYIQRLKIEQAKQLLESTHLSIQEIMNSVGYEDPLFFRTLFVRSTGRRPSDYREKYFT